MHLKQIFIFLIVGISTFCIEFVVTIFLASVIPEIMFFNQHIKSYQLSALLATIIAGIYNFILSRKYTFSHTQSIQRHLIKYIFIVSLNLLAISPFILYIFVENIQLSLVNSLIIRTLILLTWNYLVNKYFTFT